MVAKTRKEQDIEFISSPDRWPHLVLPLKRKKEGEFTGNEHGFISDPILHGINAGRRVYLGSIYSLGRNTNIDRDLKWIDYESVGAIVDDGWTVD